MTSILAISISKMEDTTHMLPIPTRKRPIFCSQRNFREECHCKRLMELSYVFIQELSGLGSRIHFYLPGGRKLLLGCSILLFGSLSRTQHREHRLISTAFSRTNTSLSKVATTPIASSPKQLLPRSKAAKPQADCGNNHKKPLE